MSDYFFRKSKTIFDRLNESDDIEILKEAPEDGDDAADAGAADAAPADDAGADAGGDDANIDDNTGDADTDDNEGMGDDQDFDIDTNIGGDDDTGDGDGGEDELGGDDAGGDLGGGEGDEEVNAKNTDIFSTLSAEEQSIKIAELKKIYNDLYIYISDMLGISF